MKRHQLEFQHFMILSSLPFWMYSLTILITDLTNNYVTVDEIKQPELQQKNNLINATFDGQTIPSEKVVKIWKPIFENSVRSVISKPKKTIRPLPEPTLPYNLMEEQTLRTKRIRSQTPFNCSIEYANANRLQQDHPCIIDLIRRFYLQPALLKNPYQLNYPNTTDPSDGQSKAILRLLRNQTKGFFVESGALDGEFQSSTIYMERFFNWTGILIESGRASFHKLKSRNRKAYALPVCLSPEPYPTEVSLEGTLTGDGCTSDSVGKKLRQMIYGDEENKVQCFPLYSILLSVNRTQIDYLSINVKSLDMIKVLNTIPCNKVDITILSVRWNRDSQMENAATTMLGKSGYVKIGSNELYHATDLIYVKDFFKDLHF